MHISSLRTGHCPAEIPARHCEGGGGVTVTSDSRGRGRSSGWSFRDRLHLGSSGQRTVSGLVTGRCLGRGSAPGRAGQICSRSDQAPRRGTARRILGQTSWQSCRFREEAGTVILSTNVPALELPGGTGPPAGRRCGPRRARLHNVPQGCRGWKQKSSLRVRRWL